MPDPEHLANQHAFGLASSNAAATSPVVVADQNTGFNAAAGADTGDGLHPNASDSSKIANEWALALAAYF